jgi:hypothetical protein
MDDTDIGLFCCTYYLHDILVIGHRKKVNINTSEKTEPQTGIILLSDTLEFCL